MVFGADLVGSVFVGPFAAFTPNLMGFTSSGPLEGVHQDSSAAVS